MPQPQPDRQQDAFLAAMAAYQVQTVQLRARLSAYLISAWRRLGSWREPDMRRFVTQVLPVIAGAQRAMLALTVANLAQQRSIALGTPTAPIAVDPRDVTGGAARNGTSPTQVYERPFHLTWRQLAELPHEPGAIEQAIQAGEDRVVQAAITDLQLTKQHTARRVLSEDGEVVGYRRVLEGAHSCAFCMVASTQRYHKSELLPIHPACDCSVSPIYGTADPGQIIEAAIRNDDDTLTPVAELPDIHDLIDAAFGDSDSGARQIPGTASDYGRLLHYRDALVSHPHGELGPVLGARNADHRTLAQLKGEHSGN